jgi:ferrous-iron efflux pump FieF
VSGGAEPAPPVSLARQAQLMKRATYASVAIVAVLVVAKTGAWLLTDSVSVLSSLLDSMLDAAASLVNLVAVRHALTPADREHRFGHGKAEPLAGLAQAAFIAGSSVLLVLEALNRLASPSRLAHAEIGIAVMVLSIVLTIALVAYQRRVIRATGSVAIDADSLHYQGDLLLNGSVILSLGLSMWLGWGLLDPVFAVAIAGFLLHSAWAISRKSLDRLMDRELPDADRARLRAIALANPEVRAVHDLRTRSSGPDLFIQFHLEMDGGMTLGHSHEVSDAVEREIMAAYPNAEVIIHQDPAGIEETRKTFAQG